MKTLMTINAPLCFPLATLKKRVLPKLDAQKQDELASK